MRVSVPKESRAGERRVAATPDTVQRLTKLGFVVSIERDAGNEAGYTDAAYAEAGARIVDDPYPDAQLVVKVNPPTDAELGRMAPGTLLIALLYPLQNQPLVQAIAARGLSAIALDRIPRISRAQKMDVLSSMGNIAGYRAVIEAANVLPRFFGGQITAAGKTPPARVLVIGAGVAGLAAIGAARGLGAEVYAFDTRKPVREQVESMGGKFLTVEIEESGDGGGGYAKEMSPAFIAAEMALFREHAPKSDIVITTALIPGKKAPLLWTADMVAAMKPGSVVVDLAAAQGGNCELTTPGEVTKAHGVTLIGYTDLTSRLPGHASQFFARNVVHLLEDMGGGEKFKIDHGDECVRGALIVENGAVLP
ncbi:MAG: Re/Si-specific NAD(P)(+) transhydrogenase subunit alpha, partial [Myxococcota bacterium]